MADWWQEAQAAHPRYAGGSLQDLSVDITERDAASFLRGLDAQPPIFWIEGGLRVRSERLGRRKDGAFKELTFFEGRDGKFWVRAETIAHYAALTEVILDHGWARDQVVSEPDGPDRSLSGALDIHVFHPDKEQVVVAVEAKGSAQQLERMVSRINKCQGQPFSAGHGASEHKKCLALERYEPPVFWGVAPGVRKFYVVDVTGPHPRLLSRTAS